MGEPTKNEAIHEPKDVDTNQPKWDTFFKGGSSVSPNFMEERTLQDVTHRSAVGGGSWLGNSPA